MKRLIACLIALPLSLAAAPANACAPPSANFARGSSILDALSRAEIASVAEAFRRAPPGSRVELDSVTDSAGSAAANRRMAQRRAEAVRVALVRHGVPDGRIDIQISLVRDGGRLVWMNINTRPGCV